MESCCIYIYVLWIPSRTVVQCYYFVFHPHESAWWAPLNRFYAGLAGIAETCIGSILRVLQWCIHLFFSTTCRMEGQSILHGHYDQRHRGRYIAVNEHVFKWLHLRSKEVHSKKMPYDERYTSYVERTGLLPFIQLVSRSMPHMNPCLITALVDRWRPETHSFHLPCGEITVTLQDVSMILALPIKGQPILMSTDSKNWRERMMELIGDAPTTEKMSAG